MAKIPTKSELEKVLLERVTPFLHSHNGDIQVESISENGEVRVSFQGACANCPSLGDTLSNSVEAAITEAFPKANLKVIAVNKVDEQLWNIAKNILRKK